MINHQQSAFEYKKYKNMYACIINIYVPHDHEVKYQRAIAKRTSQMM